MVDEDFKTRLDAVNLKKYEDEFDELFSTLDPDLQPHVMTRIAIWHLERYFQYVGKTVSMTTVGMLSIIADNCDTRPTHVQ